MRKRKSAKEIDIGEKKKYEEFYNEYVDCLLIAKVSENKESFQYFIQNEENKIKLKSMFSKIDS